MTSEPRYRWQAAETLKQAEQAAAALELAQAERALTRAREDAADAQRAIARHAVSAPAGRALEPGIARAVDLKRTAAFAAHHAETARSLRAELARAEAEVAARHAAVVQKQALLALAHAGEQTIERDRLRFEREQRKRAEQAEQHEHEERRLGNPGGRERL